MKPHTLVAATLRAAGWTFIDSGEECQRLCRSCEAKATRFARGGWKALCARLERFQMQAFSPSEAALLNAVDAAPMLEQVQ
ncbi:MAG: hypothetical protein KA233_10360, partial [Novosphingobium sp.]|nr:hypothetical protein [Novosphingobium sp.]